jgi:hypothetical protein
MKRFLIFILLLSLFRLPGNAQELTISDSVYSLPFHIDAGLLVLKGKMNGVETDFAFDTGASMGLANSLAEPAQRLEVKGGKIKMRDSNSQATKVPTGVTEEIQLGDISFPKVRSLVNDMEYLYCLDYYLLGSDIIGQLNWEIDFENMIIRFSRAPFPAESGFMSFPVTYSNNRPFVSVNFAGKEFKNILIDTGYSQVFSYPANSSSVQAFISKMDSLGLSNPNIRGAMGALSSSTVNVKTILVDSLKIGEHYLNDIPVDFEVSSGPKLGLRFFTSLGSRLIINNSESSYHISIKSEGASFQDPMQMGVQFQNGKLILKSKSIGAVSEDELIEVGEEINSVNGRTSTSFQDSCEFIRWSYTSKPEVMKIQKMDGTELTFLPVKLK